MSVQNNLERAWTLILDQYKKKAEEVAKEEGAGISVFRMMTKQKENGTNCEFLYDEVDGPMWTELFKNSPNADEIKRIYDPTTMYMICVCVHIHPQSLETIQNIRLFKFDDGSEVELKK